MKPNSNRSLLIGLGALWGLSEATLGWGMHLLHLPYRSLVLFPIGLFLMLYGVRRTGKARAAWQIAMIAALIKLTNLLMPGIFPAYYVINPAVAVLLEGLAVFAFSYFYFEQPEGKNAAFYTSWVSAFAWILLYQFAFTGWQAWMSALTEPNPAFLRMTGAANLLPFLFQTFLKGGMLAVVAWWLGAGWKSPFRFQPSWIGSISLFALALIVNYITV